VAARRFDRTARDQGDTPSSSRRGNETALETDQWADGACPGLLARGRVLSSFRDGGGVPERSCGGFQSLRYIDLVSASRSLFRGQSGTVQPFGDWGLARMRHDQGTLTARLVARFGHARLCSVVTAICGLRVIGMLDDSSAQA
jgi:hypothetical protein